MLKKLGFVFIVLMVFIAAMTVVYAGNEILREKKLFRRRILPKRTAANTEQNTVQKAPTRAKRKPELHLVKPGLLRYN